MVCSAQIVKVAVKSAKIGASSHVTNSILKNAAKWLVYASTVTYVQVREDVFVVSAELEECNLCVPLAG